MDAEDAPFSKAEKARAEWLARVAAEAEFYRAIPGGDELMTFHGGVPSFHDGEVMTLELSSTTASRLSLLSWRGYPQNLDTSRPYIATFRIGTITRMELSGFEPRMNILFDLFVRRIGRSDELQLELSPSVGLSGTINCRELSVDYRALRPKKIRD